MYRPLRPPMSSWNHLIPEFQSQAGCIGLSDPALFGDGREIVPGFNPRRDVSASQTKSGAAADERGGSGFNPRRDVSASQTALLHLSTISYWQFQSQAGCIGLSDLFSAEETRA